MLAYLYTLSSSYPSAFRLYITSSNPIFSSFALSYLFSLLPHSTRFPSSTSPNISTVDPSSSDIFFNPPPSLLPPPFPFPIPPSHILPPILTDLVEQNLPFLCKIDVALTHQLILRLGAKEKMMVGFLEGYPKLQRDFLERVVGRREEGGKVEDDVLILHVEIMCRDGEDEKVTILKN